MISSSLTDEPDFVDYGKTGDMTALDKIGKWLGLFKAESAGELAQKQLNANLILENYKKSTLPTFTGDPFTVGIIGDKPLTAELAQLKIQVLRMESDVELNHEFRVKWPRGELGALPDDAEQNLKLEYIQRDVDELKAVVKQLELKSTE